MPPRKKSANAPPANTTRPTIPLVQFLLSGATGFVGRYLDGFLRANGHQTRRLVRSTPKEDGDMAWDPVQGILNPQAFDGIDVVINLNGASIAGQRWTPAYKRELLESRIIPTALLAQTMARLEKPPPLFISFSGAGYYGWTVQAPDTPLDLALKAGEYLHRRGYLIPTIEFGEDNAVPAIETTEDSPSGSSFVARLAQQWEAAADPARQERIRVFHPRLGVVIGNGGMLAKLLPLFRLGLGARLGSGRQPFSWVALEDIGPGLLHCIEHKLEGAVNFTGPQPVNNAQFT
jgi:uncharacterized protein